MLFTRGFSFCKCRLFSGCFLQTYSSRWMQAVSWVAVSCVSSLCARAAVFVCYVFCFVCVESMPPPSLFPAGSRGPQRRKPPPPKAPTCSSCSKPLRPPTSPPPKTRRKSRPTSMRCVNQRKPNLRVRALRRIPNLRVRSFQRKPNLRAGAFRREPNLRVISCT